MKLLLLPGDVTEKYFVAAQSFPSQICGPGCPSDFPGHVSSTGTGLAACLEDREGAGRGSRCLSLVALSSLVWLPKRLGSPTEGEGCQAACERPSHG